MKGPNPLGPNLYKYFCIDELLITRNFKLIRNTLNYHFLSTKLIKITTDMQTVVIDIWNALESSIYPNI